QHQFWTLDNGRGMSFDVFVTEPAPLALSMTVSEIGYFPSGAVEASPFWRLGGDPLVMNMTVAETGSNSGTLTFNIPNFWQGTVGFTFIDVNDPDTYVITGASEAYLPGAETYEFSLVPYMLRGNDAVTGSSGDDYLLGYNGNDTLNGGG